MVNLIDFLDINDKNVAIAVSGGADSLALALMAGDELPQYGVRVCALTVDHKLRQSSRKEAEYVHKIMSTYGIEHHILTWEKGGEISSDIEAKAREARYDLLQNWCDAHNISVLMTAHHIYDQAETFLIRLQRGSGLEGLCCIRQVSRRAGLKIIRPLLYENPQIMKDYLQKRDICWVEDESNESSVYLRNRIRKILPQLTAQTGITIEKIAAAVRNLQSSEDYIAQQVANITAKDVLRIGNVRCFFYKDYKIWHKEIKFRIFSDFLREQYIPRAESILNLIKSLDNLPFGGVTLGKHEIFIAYNKVWIVPEMSAQKLSSRKMWKKFCETHKEFNDIKIPHKAKVAILKYYGEKNDL